MYKTFVTIPKAVPDKLCDEMVKESPKYDEQLAGVMWKKEADLKKDRNSENDHPFFFSSTLSWVT